MDIYLNKRTNSPITHYQIESDSIVVRFEGGKRDYKYSYTGKAGKRHVDNMKTLAINGSGLSAYITANVKHSFDS